MGYVALLSALTYFAGRRVSIETQNTIAPLVALGLLNLAGAATHYAPASYNMAGVVCLLLLWSAARFENRRQLGIILLALLFLQFAPFTGHIPKLWRMTELRESIVMVAFILSLAISAVFAWWPPREIAPAPRA